MLTCCAFELRKLARRRQTYVVIGLANLLGMMALVAALIALPFDIGDRQQFLIPGTMGLFSMGLAYAAYFYPIGLSLLGASMFAGEEAEGTLRTLLLTFRPRWQIVLAKLVALVAAAGACLLATVLLYGVTLLLLYLKMSPIWWRAFEYPLGDVVWAFLAWAPWFVLAQAALVGFIGLVNSQCSSTGSAASLTLAILVGLAVLVAVLPHVTALLAHAGWPRDLQIERVLFPYHYGAPCDDVLCQRLVFGEVRRPERSAERTVWLAVEGLLFWVLALVLYERRDVLT